MLAKRAVFLHVLILSLLIFLISLIKSSWTEFKSPAYAQYPTPTRTRTPTRTLTPSAIPSGVIVISDPTQIHDAWVSLNSPSTNFGTNTELREHNVDWNTYMKFTVSGLTRSVVSATLRLYVTDYSPSGGTIYSVSNNYQGTSTAWTETGIIWNNAPSIGGTSLSSVGTASLNSWVTFDVTDAISGNGTFSFGIRSTNTDAVWFASSEASSATRPQLIIQQSSAPTLTPTSTTAPSPTPSSFQIYGYVYRETNNNVQRSTAVSEGLISNIDVEMSGDDAGNTTSAGSQLPGYPANYVFTQLYNGIYNVELVATPTRSVLYNPQNYTNPQIAILAGGPVAVDFPFVTVTPTYSPGIPTPTIPGGGFPTRSPTPTPLSVTPTTLPTPTSIFTTPPVCGTLPTPDLGEPAHELCTNSKPLFSSFVIDPSGDNVWAHYYSNSNEGFDDTGSVVPGSGDDSLWSPPSHVLNSSGGYWWTAYTESSSCGRSVDAPARLITMDFTPPPQPEAPTCTLVGQDYITGESTFTCSWSSVTANDGCGFTVEYHPYFWTEPGGQVWDPGWIGNQTEITVVTSDGIELYGAIEVRDGAGNISESSGASDNYTAPKINFSSSPTPGGPLYSPTPSLEPSETPTPTPGAWMQVFGGDVYQPNINQPVPPGQYFLDLMQAPEDNPHSAGLIWSQFGNTDFGFGGSSPVNWQVTGPLSNAFNFSYYWEAFKNQAKPVNNSEVGIIDFSLVSSPTPTIAGPTPTEGPVDFLPTDDTYVADGSPNTNYCTGSALHIDSGGPINVTYLKFNLGSLAGKTITNGTLNMYVNNPSSGTQTVKAVANDTWSECGITFNNKPVTGSSITTFNGGSNGTWISVNLTGQVQNEAGGIMSIAIDTNSTDALYFYSKENADFKPYLRVTTSGFFISPTPTTIPSITPTRTPTRTPTVTPTRTPTPTTGAAITFDSSSIGKRAGGSSLTVSHTTASGSNRFMIVGVTLNNNTSASQDVSSITYNGIALTKRASVNNTNHSRVAIWYLKSPATGIHDVVVTLNGTLCTACGFNVGVATFQNVNQTDSLGTTATAIGAGTTASVNVTSSSGNLIFDTVGCEACSSLTAGSGQTERWNTWSGSSPTSERIGASTEAGAGSVTTSWTLGATNDWAIIAVPIEHL